MHSLQLNKSGKGSYETIYKLFLYHKALWTFTRGQGPAKEVTTSLEYHNIFKRAQSQYYLGYFLAHVQVYLKIEGNLKLELYKDRKKKNQRR